MGFRSSVNVDEACIDAGSSKHEAGAPNRMKKSPSIELRKTNLVTSIDTEIRTSSFMKGESHENF